MALDAEKLRNWKFDDVIHTFTKRDTMLYALGAGCGSDPLDESDLKYVYEDNLVALPTMAMLRPWIWLRKSSGPHSPGRVGAVSGFSPSAS